MNREFEIGNRVVLRSFNGTVEPDEDTQPNENYWKLIGTEGNITQDPSQTGMYASFSKEKRVLIVFDENVKSLGLECHNRVPNSLWIGIKDIERILKQMATH